MTDVTHAAQHNKHTKQPAQGTGDRGNNDAIREKLILEWSE
jgi:hypothetical protein